MYGSKASFEWQQIVAEEPVIHYGEDAKALAGARLRQNVAQAEIQRFTTKGVYDLGAKPHVVHPGRWPRRLASAPGQRVRRHMAEDRDPFPNAVNLPTGLVWGLCAHHSALKGGAIVRLPEWTLA